MRTLEKWINKILAINPDRTLDNIYHSMHGLYTKEQILTVWTPEEVEEEETLDEREDDDSDD